MISDRFNIIHKKLQTLQKNHKCKPLNRQKLHNETNQYNNNKKKMKNKNNIQNNQNEQQDLINQKRQKYTTQIRKNKRQKLLSQKRVYINHNQLVVDNTNLHNNQIFTTSKIQQSLFNQNLSLKIQEFLSRTYYNHQFITLYKKINTSDPVLQHQAIIGIRKILCAQKNPPIQLIIDANLIPRMIEFIKQTKFPRLRIQATWALANIASGTTHQCQSIINQGGIPLFIELLSSSDISIAEQAIWVIGNLAGDSSYNRDLILKLGGVKYLKLLIQTSNNIEIIKSGAWALSNICINNPQTNPQLIGIAFQTLCNVLKQGRIAQFDIIINCVSAISYIINCSKTFYKLILQNGVIKTIISYLKQKSPELILLILKIFGNILSGNQNQVQQILKFDLMSIFQELLQNKQKSIRKQTCWTLSYAISANQNHFSKKVLFQDSLLSKLILILEKDNNQIKNQICSLISNLSKNLSSSEFQFLLHKYKLIKIFANLLRQVTESKTLSIILSTIYNIFLIGQNLKEQQNDAKNILVDQFNSYEVYDILQKLQHHKSPDIYYKIFQIMQQFY